MDPLLKRHKGNAEVYVQIAANPVQRVVLRLDRERFVRPSTELKQQIESLPGADSVQFSGAGTRRRKRVSQEPLFKEETSEQESAPLASAEAAPPPEPEMDPLEYAEP